MAQMPQENFLSNLTASEPSDPELNMSFFANKCYGVVWGKLDTSIPVTPKYLLSVMYSTERWATPNSAQQFRSLTRRARTDLLPTQSPHISFLCVTCTMDSSHEKLWWKRSLNKVGGPKQFFYPLYSHKADVQQEFCANTLIFLTQKPFFLSCK